MITETVGGWKSSHNSIIEKVREVEVKSAPVQARLLLLKLSKEKRKMVAWWSVSEVPAPRRLRREGHEFDLTWGIFSEPCLNILEN